MGKLLTIVFLFVVSFICDVSAMSWQLINESNHRFVVSFFPEETSTKNLGVNLVVSCDENSLKTLTTELQKKFQKSGDEYVYSLFEFTDDGSDNKSETSNFMPEDRKLVCKGLPTKMSCEELNEIIKTKKVILYTGAGISAAAIPTMNILMSQLKMSEDLRESDKLQNYISDVINNPEKYTEILRDFFDCCENAKPTIAHVLLSKCAKKFNHLLITENVDRLHQNSGIDPIVLAGCDKYSGDENIMEAVKKSDFIVTIGLNADESGFLKFYKTQNPQGRIISVNLTPTNYLSNADFFVEGDIQEIAEKIFEL